MLDRLDRGPIPDKAGLQVPLSGQMGHMRRDVDALEVGPLESDAVIGGSRLE